MKAQVLSFRSDEPQWTLFRACVKGGSREAVVLETADGIVTAVLAFSCLVQPVAGDTVLVSSYQKTHYVLAVLEREASQDMKLSFPANASLNAPRGRIQVAATEALSLMSAQKTQIISPDNSMTGEKTTIISGTIEATSREVKAHTRSAVIVADTIDTVARRIIQRATTVMRRVESVETLNIGNLVQTVRKSFTSRSHHTVLTAREEMRIDGERINMG